MAVAKSPGSANGSRHVRPVARGRVCLQLVFQRRLEGQHLHVLDHRLAKGQVGMGGVNAGINDGHRDVAADFAVLRPYLIGLHQRHGFGQEIFQRAIQGDGIDFRPICHLHNLATGQNGAGHG
jgi:hypothetical protein